jgi:protein ImuA
MRESVFMAEASIGDLRRRIAEIERRPVEFVELSSSPVSPAASRVVGSGKRSCIPFGITRLDRQLCGGLRRAALHEIRSNESRDAAAATGFAVAILAQLGSNAKRPILWIVESASAQEAGFPYASGLARFGLLPSQLIVACTANPVDALWVFEEGLRCCGLAAVLTEIRGNPHQLDLTASRRLALRAREHGVMGLLLRQTDWTWPSAATTRWLVTARPAAITDDFTSGIGDPAWRVTLERNRLGGTGTFDLEWNHERQTFIASDTKAHSLLVAPVSSNRSAAPSDVGQVVALARAS